MGRARRRSIPKPKNGKWLFSPAAYLYKKWLDLFWQKLNILRKKGKFNFKRVGTT
jgi:hypothetical protein